MLSPPTLRLVRWSQALVLAMCCFAAAPLTAQTEELEPAPEEGLQAPEEDVQVFQDWRVRCESQDDVERCVMFQNLVYRESGQTILSIQIGRNANQQASAVFIVPLGVILPPGVQLEIDGGSPTTIDYQQCSRQSCVAPFPLDDALLSRMKRGLEAQVTFHAVVQGSRRPITVPVSLKGFTAAFNNVR